MLVAIAAPKSAKAGISLGVLPIIVGKRHDLQALFASYVFRHLSSSSSHLEKTKEPA
jgi:hypothetical protein